MRTITEKDEENISSMRNTIREGLQSIEFDGNWLEAYEAWREEERNQFEALLTIKDPFNLACVGDREEFDLSDPNNVRDLDIFCMSIFLSETLRSTTLKIFAEVRKERIRDRKVARLEEYFDLLKTIIDSKQLSVCIVTLNDLAEKQMALQGKRTVDLYGTFYSLREILRKSSVESLYLLLTYWRIRKDRKILKDLTKSVVDYIQTYFDEFDKDPEMHLYYPLDGMMTVKKLAVIERWFEIIAFHTNGIFEKYQELRWLRPVDRMADDIIETSQISKCEMMYYKSVFSSDDNKTVQQKAVCNHGYGIWRKTVDVMYIVCDIFQILYNYTDEELKKMNASKAAMLEEYDNMVKVRDYYTRKVFFHQVYFQLERRYLDSQIMEALEEDAENFSKSIDNVLDFVNAIAGDDIEGLMQAKQKYISTAAEYISGDQEEKLDDLTSQVVDKIKATIQKLDVYDELYGAISGDFDKYASELVKHPQIFSSLVSAEYLYRQYVEGKSPITNFDYSCISIMYYMALEDFINKLVYIPYSREVLSQIDSTDLNDRSWQRNESSRYVSSFGKFWSYGRLKQSCEIGVLGFLFEAVPKEDKFEQWLLQKFPSIDANAVKAFGTKLKGVSQRRNDAAHGGNYLTYSDVCTDKHNVYDTDVQSFRGMIVELMELCFG